MEEKFSTSLELKIDKFKEQTNKVKGMISYFAEQVKSGMEIDTNPFEGMSADAEYLKRKIDDIKGTLTISQSNPKLFNKSEILDMRVELEKLEKQFDKIQNTGKGSNINTMFSGITSNVNKSINSIKRFGLSLFGIQSIYRSLSRASSAYLTQDEDTSKKIQSAWIGLGSIFAPLLEKVADFVIKAVSYINVFIKALTGTDFLANAMAKSMNKANKSAGKLSKTLAGFDELTNLDSDTSGGSIDTSWIDSFKNVELDQNVVKWLETVAEKIKENKDLVIGIASVIAGIVIIPKLITLVSTIKNLFAGLTLIKGLGLGIALIGIAITIKGIIDFIKDPSWKNFNTILIGIGITIAGISLLLGNWIGLAIGLGVALVGLTVNLFSNNDAIMDTKEAQEQLKKAQEDLIEATNNYIDAVDRAEEMQRALNEAQKRTGLSGEELYKQVQNGTLDYKNMTDVQREVYRAYLNNEKAQEALGKSTEILTEKKKEETIKSYNNQLIIAQETKAYDEFKNKVVEAFKKGELTAGETRDFLEKAMKDMSTKSRTTFMEDIPDNIKNGLDPKKYESVGTKIKNWFGDLGSSISSLWNKVTGNLSVNVSGNVSGVPKYDVGTNYVPNDQLAMIHKGEAIVPKKFNSNEYFSGIGNSDRVVSKLDAVIDRIENIEMNPYTTVKDVGQASSRYTSQYSRIMGV